MRIELIECFCLVYERNVSGYASSVVTCRGMLGSGHGRIFFARPIAG